MKLICKKPLIEFGLSKDKIYHTTKKPDGSYYTKNDRMNDLHFTHDELNEYFISLDEIRDKKLTQLGI